MNIQDILVTRFVLSGYNQTLNSLRRMGDAVGRLNGASNNITKGLGTSQFANNVGEGLTALTAAGVAFSVKYGSAMLESENLSGRVFGTMSKDVEDFSKKMQKAGSSLNEYEIRRQAAVFFNLATSLKIPREQALEMSKAMVQLGVDMSSFYDVPVERVMNNLASGLIGNTRALYSYGISLDQATLKNYAYKNGIAATGSELTKQQKVMAAFGELMNQSEPAHGDFLKSFPSSMVNQLRAIMADLRKELAEAGVGMQKLLFGALKMGRMVIPIFNGLTEVISRVPPELQLVGLSFLAAAGPILKFNTAMFQAQLLSGSFSGSFGKFLGGKWKTFAAAGVGLAAVATLARMRYDKDNAAAAANGTQQQDINANTVFLDSAKGEEKRRRDEHLKFPGSENKPLLRAIAGGQIETPDDFFSNPANQNLDYNKDDRFVKPNDYIPKGFPDSQHDVYPGMPSNFKGFRATGGPTQKGKSYIVGEKGPELFFPSENGSVIPNHQLEQAQKILNKNSFIKSGGTTYPFDGFKQNGDPSALSNLEDSYDLKSSVANGGRKVGGVASRVLFGFDIIKAVEKLDNYRKSFGTTKQDTGLDSEYLKRVFSGQENVLFGDDKRNQLLKLREDKEIALKNNKVFKGGKDILNLEREQTLSQLFKFGEDSRSTEDRIKVADIKKEAASKNGDVQEIDRYHKEIERLSTNLNTLKTSGDILMERLKIANKLATVPISSAISASESVYNSIRNSSPSKLLSSARVAHGLLDPVSGYDSRLKTSSRDFNNNLNARERANYFYGATNEAGRTHGLIGQVGSVSGNALEKFGGTDPLVAMHSHPSGRMFQSMPTYHGTLLDRNDMTSTAVNSLKMNSPMSKAVVSETNGNRYMNHMFLNDKFMGLDPSKRKLLLNEYMKEMVNSRNKHLIAMTEGNGKGDALVGFRTKTPSMTWEPNGPIKPVKVKANKFDNVEDLNRATQMARDEVANSEISKSFGKKYGVTGKFSDYIANHTALLSGKGFSPDMMEAYQSGRLNKVGSLFGGDIVRQSTENANFFRGNSYKLIGRSKELINPDQNILDEVRARGGNVNDTNHIKSVAHEKLYGPLGYNWNDYGVNPAGIGVGDRIKSSLLPMMMKGQLTSDAAAMAANGSSLGATRFNRASTITGAAGFLVGRAVDYGTNALGVNEYKDKQGKVHDNSIRLPFALGEMKRSQAYGVGAEQGVALGGAGILSNEKIFNALSNSSNPTVQRVVAGLDKFGTKLPMIAAGMSAAATSASIYAKQQSVISAGGHIGLGDRLAAGAIGGIAGGLQYGSMVAGTALTGNVAGGLILSQGVSNVTNDITSPLSKGYDAQILTARLNKEKDPRNQTAMIAGSLAQDWNSSPSPLMANSSRSGFGGYAGSVGGKMFSYGATGAAIGGLVGGAPGAGVGLVGGAAIGGLVGAYQYFDTNGQENSRQNSIQAEMMVNSQNNIDRHSAYKQSIQDVSGTGLNSEQIGRFRITSYDSAAAQRAQSDTESMLSGDTSLRGKQRKSLMNDVSPAFQKTFQNSNTLRSQDEEQLKNFIKAYGVNALQSADVQQSVVKLRGAKALTGLMKADNNNIGKTVDSIFGGSGGGDTGEISNNKSGIGGTPPNSSIYGDTSGLTYAQVHSNQSATGTRTNPFVQMSTESSPSNYDVHVDVKISPKTDAARNQVKNS